MTNETSTTEVILRFTKLNNFEMGNKKIPIDHETDSFLFSRGLLLDYRLSNLTKDQIEIIRCFGLLQTQMVLTQNAALVDLLLSDKRSEILEKEVSLLEREKKVEKDNKGKIATGTRLTWRQRLFGVL